MLWHQDEHGLKTIGEYRQYNVMSKHIKRQITLLDQIQPVQSDTCGRVMTGNY